MKLDASALRALNLVEAPGETVSLCQTVSWNAELRFVGYEGSVEQEHDTAGFAQQVQDCSGHEAFGELAEATTGESARNLYAFPRLHHLLRLILVTQ
jgi:hypothetical protein